MRTAILILFMLFALASNGQNPAVPNRATFTLGHVTLSVYGDSTVGRNTSTIFDDAIAVQFDSNYGSKTMSPQTINGFRNYGTKTEPALTTRSVNTITTTTAYSGGDLSSTGGATITDVGVCWSLSANPTIADYTSSNGAIQSGGFNTYMSGLTAGTTYHVRAYATNGVGTGYGDDLTFGTTSSCNELATILTTHMTAYSATVAQAEVNLTSHGSGCTVTEMGMVYGTSANPTISGTHTSTATVATGAYPFDITGLTANTTYYYRAFATNSYGTAYGAEYSMFQCVRPSGLTTGYLYSMVNFTNVNISNYCNFGTTPADDGQSTKYTVQSTWTEGDPVYTGTGTDCTKLADGYYVYWITSGGGYWIGFSIYLGNLTPCYL